MSSQARISLVVDFVNTAELEEGRDALDSPAALTRWLAARGLVPPAARASRADVGEAHALREALRDLGSANNGADVDLHAASAVVEHAARRARVELHFRAGGVSLEPRAAGVRGALGAVVAAAAAAMGDGTWPRVKACRSASCRWLFYDTARNRSRAWCDMSVCGNREKARAYRARHGRAA